MTFPSDSEAASGPPEEEQEIVLRLADILPRVPTHLLKPGPHDTALQVRFSVDELAAKISRGRVSVPFKRLSQACPAVFRDSHEFPGEPEIQLPLQKLLEQVGLMAPKPPSTNGVPRDQVTQARAEAGRILEERGAGSSGPASDPTGEAARNRPAAEAPAPNPTGIGKAISTARQIFGRFGLGAGGGTQSAPEEAQAEPAPVATAETKPASEAPQNAEAVSTRAEPEPAAQPVSEPLISLAVLSIFRLLPGDLLRPGALPPADARLHLPLAAIDSQLAGGHVEIPVQQFVAALPAELRDSINPAPGANVWIPLDEIFQNLPADHLFYIPCLEHVPEPVAATVPEPPQAEASVAAPEQLPTDAKSDIPSEPVLEQAEAPQSVPEKPAIAEEAGVGEVPPPIEGMGSASVEDPAAPAEAANLNWPESEVESKPAAQSEPGSNAAEQEKPAETAIPEASAPEVAAPAAEHAHPPAIEPPPIEPRPIEPPPIEPPTAQIDPPTVEPAQPAPVAVTPPPVIPAAAAPEPATSRAPWMRGFQIPPPKLFGGRGSVASPPSVEPAGVVTAPPPAPEAKRSADFLASQPGIFAAAAFVQGAVFASADFPRKPDLDALREFMGAFIENAQASGQRLAWNRLLTIECEQFYVTAVVRETHFVVALHHDRILPSLAHDALIASADELGRAAG